MISPLNTFDFLARAAKIYPERIAVVDGNLRLTYSEFMKRSLSLSKGLHDLRLKRDDVISVLDYNTHHTLELYFASAYSGLKINPLNFRNSPADLSYMSNYVKSKVIFIHQDFLDMFERIRGDLSSLQYVITIEGSDSHRDYISYEKMLKEGAIQQGPIDENDVAEILFTSGSSDRPKAVGLTYRNLYLNALYTIIAYGMTEDDTLLHVVPLFHANGGGTPQTITAVGGKHVMLRKIDADSMIKLIERESVTMFVAVPTVLQRFLTHSDFGSYDTSSLKRIIVVGTAASPDLIQETESKIPSCECLSAYGMTESGPLVAMARLKLEERKLPEKEKINLKTRTGYEVIGTRIKIVGSDGDPDAKEGEILINGNSVFNGYYGNERATDEAISDGWFRTGDWGRKLPGGWITIVDRAKDMIKSGGENISSSEVENVILTHASISEAAVIPIPDREWGEVPKAFVVRKQSESITESELIEYCRSKMAHFKVPKSVEFVDALPRTVTGKIAKGELRRKFWVNRERQIN